MTSCRLAMSQAEMLTTTSRYHFLMEFTNLVRREYNTDRTFQRSIFLQCAYVRRSFPSSREKHGMVTFTNLN